MKKYWRYLKYVLRHKWYVFKACYSLGVPLSIAFWHDWTKFLPDEFIPYARYFYGDYPLAKDAHLGALAGFAIFPRTKEQVEQEFTKAWNAHQKRNKHHWQYWLITWDRGDTEALEMPRVFMLEMLADWRGAGKALGKPDTKAWYLENYTKIKLHPTTRLYVDMELFTIFDERPSEVASNG